MTGKEKTAAEKLCEAAVTGKAILGPREEILADDVRKLVLPLQFEGGARPAIRSIGIEIQGGIIDGRLNLDHAMGADGGPLPALRFHGCTFKGGFSGAHSHFSHLAFSGECRFIGSPVDPRGRPVPTIDLSGAVLDGGLSMRGVAPEGDDDFLWIRAPGTRIGGHLDLSCAHLRAPEDTSDRFLSEPPIDALDLACVEIRNDFQFLGGARSEGRISARNAKIGGDVWLSGASIENPDDDGLFFQGATVAGVMVLDDRADLADGSGEVRQFRCDGWLNLLGAEIGRDLQLGKAVVLGGALFTDLTVKNDLIFGAYVRVGVSLAGCRIGGTLDLSDLTLGVSAAGMNLIDGSIGRSLKLIRSGDGRRPAHKLLKARRAMLKSLPGVELVETLWDYEMPTDPGEAAQHSETMQRVTAQIGFLIKGTARFRLDGRVGSLEDAVESFGLDIGDDEAAKEYLRLHCTYGPNDKGPCPVVLGQGEGQLPPFLDGLKAGMDEKLFDMKVKAVPKGFTVTALVVDGDRHLYRRAFRLAPGEDSVEIRRHKGRVRGGALTGVPLFDGPLILHPKFDDEAKEAAARNRWVTAETLAGMDDCAADERATLEDQLFEYLLSNLSLRGEVRLSNLSCAMLHDYAGRYWGSQVKIGMDHFVYSRASWGPDAIRPTPAAGQSQERGLRHHARRWVKAIAEKYRAAKDSLWKKIKRGAAETLPVFLTDLCGWTKGLRLGDHWTPWEIRRNWIYQQFGPHRVEHLPSPARYRINSSEYRPHPFEQAISVSRSEGREDYAIHFEILKRNIEWRLFSRRNWEWFFFLGLFAMLAWLTFHRANLTREVVIAAALIGAGLTFISPICHRIMDSFFGHLRRPVRAIATLVIAFLLGWAGVHAANGRGMMVIDVEPVATLVGEKQQVLVIGSPRQADVQNLASNVHCGNHISEALYALDVLVPLIDLREENRCEVGQALPGERYRRDGFMGTLESLAPDPPTFWSVLKALYAIAGWFIVSLSILTFAQITRARGESS